jgi:hypothetical protein
MTAGGWRVDGPAEVTRPRPVVGRLLQHIAGRLQRWSTVTVIDDHGQP